VTVVDLGYSPAVATAKSIRASGGALGMIPGYAANRGYVTYLDHGH